ncbi:hypothetical protein SISSUDRAFT_1002838, partial [Sistotremastrum suecicum HHB10207 ss-3]
MMRVTPETFQHLLGLIDGHPIFTTHSNNQQTPVETQLSVLLYRAGRYGNGASVADVARVAGISEGAVLLFSRRVMTAILSLQGRAMRKVTEEEKRVEMDWVEERTGCPSFRNGWLTVDGTIVVLAYKPSLNGSAYFTRKMNYGLNVQVINLFSNLRIVDYVTGFTGSAHDSSVFEHAGVVKYADWFFGPNEFIWADSAY